MIIRATLLDAPLPNTLRHVEDGIVVVDDAGLITAAGPASELLSEALLAEHDLFEAPSGGKLVCLPGLIDLHTHLPQYPVVARREEALLPWLQRHIFPTELDFQGPGQRSMITAFFKELLANGTTTAVLYGAVWEDSTELAFEIASDMGLRAVIGKMMMDEGSYGEALPAEARRKSLEETERLATRWQGANKGLLDYAVSPRFAVTCSMELMLEAAAIAERTGCYIQTHLSESTGEIRTVRDRFPECSSYTEVYRRAGLLGPRSIFGHAIHLTDDEIDLLVSSGSRVAHCPTANLFLNSGLCPLQTLRTAGVPVGLGSDVAAGPELNLWQVMRSAIETQAVRRMADDAIPTLTPADALHLATTGAATALGKESLIGSLDPGKDADLLLLDLREVLPMEGRFSPSLDAHALATALVYRAHPTATVATFTRGTQTR
jgi:guanine deaminase